MNEACNSTFFSPGPWGGVIMPKIIKFQLQSHLQRFLYQTLCVLTNKTYQIGFSFCSVGHAPGLGLWRGRGQKFDFSEHGHAQIDFAIQILTLYSNAVL